MKRLLVAIAALACAAHASAQSRPVVLVVPFAAGGGPDVQARQFAVKLAPALGVPVVVENKVGAAGVLAVQYVMQAKPDGSLILLGSNSQMIQKLLTPDLKFDPLTDFVPVGNVASAAAVLVVRTDHPARSVQDLIAALRAAGGKANYASGGIGTAAHLAGATFLDLNRVRASHIPLKGSVEITASLLRGDTDFSFPVSGTSVPQVKAGRLRALAVTSAKRMPALPDVPTLYELTKNDLLVQESWFGMWAPLGTPGDVVKRLHAASVKALADPDLQQQLANGGGSATPSASPAAFAAFMKSETAKWAKIVKLSSAKAD
jgi:tripartite-type tricarboxylate transporter receptor subunit TctC